MTYDCRIMVLLTLCHFLDHFVHIYYIFIYHPLF